MNALWTVCRKEITENLRDRRTVMSTFLFGPLFGPILFVLLMSFVIGQELKRSEKPLEVPIVGAEHAPNLVNWLKAAGVEVKPAPADPEAAVRKHDFDVIVRIPADYGEDFAAGKRAGLELLIDRSQVKAQQSIERVRSLLETYSRTTAVQRLMLRGVNPELIAPLKIADVDFSTPQSRAGMLLSFVPYLLILTVFAGAMYLAIDTTAGERERQSLEPLLINPVARSSVMLGKLLATAIFATASLILCITAFSLTSGLIPSERMAISIKLGLNECLLLFVVTVPIALIGAAVEVTVAAFSKSYREAQTYLSILIILPALPSMLMAINPVKPADWMYYVPLLSQQLLIEQTVKGEGVELFHLGCSVVTALALGAIFAVIASRLYHREALAVSA